MKTLTITTTYQFFKETEHGNNLYYTRITSNINDKVVWIMGKQNSIGSFSAVGIPIEGQSYEKLEIEYQESLKEQV